MESKNFQKMNLNDYVKDNPPQRLQSLRLPRDLTLGGSKGPKRAHKPNVNAVRHKNKTEAPKRADRGRSQPQRKFSERDKARFVQSTGIFSEGIGSNVGFHLPNHKAKVREKRVVDRPDLPNRQVQFRDVEVNKGYEEHVLDMMVKTEEGPAKEKLTPFKPIEWSMPESCIKNETDTEDKLPSDNEQVHIQDISLMSLWQLPHSFPFEQSKETKSGDTNLDDLSNGKIGKIYIRKSGKMEIYIGGVKYEVEKCKSEVFCEEAVALDANKQTAFVLGDIQNRFVLNPNWDSLLTL